MNDILKSIYFFIFKRVVLKKIIMKEFWNEKFSNKEYVYGKTPNQFFKDTLDNLNIKGKILHPAEGEGRNAVYSAQKGLTVFAFDISREGKNKALKLAKEKNVNINYDVCELMDLPFENQTFDAACLTYAHFGPNLREKYHKKIGEMIKIGGFVILEGFSKNNLELKLKNPKVGGPSNIDMLFSKVEIKNDFSNFEVISLDEKKIELVEGLLHNGFRKVIQFVGRKVG